MEPHEYRQMFRLEERHWWYRALRRQIERTLGAAGALPSQGNRPRCLDAGCGTGMNLALLSEHYECVGLDFSAEALELAHQRVLPSLLQASVDQLPLRESRFDLVLSADVLYHRGVADDVAAMIEMKRCLKPGGLLLLNLPAFPWLRSAHDEAIHTVRRYTRSEVAAKLERAGLEAVDLHYWNWVLFPPLALVRSVRALGRGGAAQSTVEAESSSKSDLTTLPSWINRILDVVLRAEAGLSWSGAPAGLSIMALARRPRG